MAHTASGAWIPDSVARQYSAMNQEHGAELDRMLESGVRETLDEWNRVLHQIDPELMMVKARENADTPGITPGYYHVVRRNESGPPSIIPVETPEGKFMEPDSSVLEKLRMNDLWNDRARRERDRALEELDRQAARRKEREREEIREEVADRWKAVSSPGVSFTNQGKGWSYRAKAPKA